MESGNRLKQRNAGSIDRSIQLVNIILDDALRLFIRLKIIGEKPASRIVKKYVRCTSLTLRVVRQSPTATLAAWTFAIVSSQCGYSKAL
eukprot:5773951-Pleurochrysis_carterae.AAC.1